MTSSSEIRVALLRNVYRLGPWDWQGLESLLGPSVARYFVFMAQYITFLALPAILSVAVYLLDTHDGRIDSQLPMAFGIFMFAIWGPALVGSLSRSERNATASDQSEARRERMPNYNPNRRSFTTIALHYLISSLVTVVSLALAAGAMILCFNLDGYFVDSSSPLYLTFLNSLRNEHVPGVVYNDDYLLVQYLPTMFHSCLILLINFGYAKLAAALTRFENHEFVADFEASVLLKRIPFELFDCFISLLYLAFYAEDITQLRHELLGLFLADTLRRLCLETFVPFVQYHFMKKIRRSKSKEEEKPEYESEFDDMIEMLIQYGYILLFASVFPMASLLAFFANMIEIRSDLFKMLFVFRMQRRMSSHNELIWMNFFKFITYAASLTNGLLYSIGHDGHPLYIFVILEHAGLISSWVIIHAIELFPEFDWKVASEKIKSQ